MSSFTAVTAAYWPKLRQYHASKRLQRHFLAPAPERGLCFAALPPDCSPPNPPGQAPHMLLPKATVSERRVPHCALRCCPGCWRVLRPKQRESVRWKDQELPLHEAAFPRRQTGPAPSTGVRVADGPPRGWRDRD